MQTLATAVPFRLSFWVPLLENETVWVGGAAALAVVCDVAINSYCKRASRRKLHITTKRWQTGSAKAMGTESRNMMTLMSHSATEAEADTRNPARN